MLPAAQDRPQEECGVFGIFAPERDVARLTFFALFALQHRGQESAGIAVSDQSQIVVFKEMGLVSQVFNESVLRSLSGEMAIGHVRYSTTGSSSWRNAQPIHRDRDGRAIALAHNAAPPTGRFIPPYADSFGQLGRLGHRCETLIHVGAQFAVELFNTIGRFWEIWVTTLKVRSWPRTTGVRGQFPATTIPTTKPVAGCMAQHRASRSSMPSNGGYLLAGGHHFPPTTIPFSRNRRSAARHSPCVS